MIVDCILSCHEYSFLASAENYIAVVVKVFRSVETVLTLLEKGAPKVEVRADDFESCGKRNLVLGDKVGKKLFDLLL